MATASSRCLLVTGPPGVGKTTLVMRVLESLRGSQPNLTIRGFYTREVREGGERVGFEVVTLDGRSGPLSSSKVSSSESVRWPTVGKYKVDVASLESLALPELQVNEETDLFIIDEVGKMELFSSAIFPAVMRVIESNIPVLATIPIPRHGRDIPGGALPIHLSRRSKQKFYKVVYMMNKTHILTCEQIQAFKLAAARRHGLELEVASILWPVRTPSAVFLSLHKKYIDSSPSKCSRLYT